LGIGILQGALAGGQRAGAPRPPTDPAAKESSLFDTRHNRFGVLSPASTGGFSAARFLFHNRKMNYVNAEPRGHARSRRGCLIVKATHHENRRRLNLVALATSPFFHVSLPQRLSPLESIALINRPMDADSVTEFAKLYLSNSYAFAPRHLLM